LKLEADLHTHTIASDGYSTIREMAECAKQKGLKVIAISDHGLGMDGGPHSGRLKILSYITVPLR
jgi:putative hydrolase